MELLTFVTNIGENGGYWAALLAAFLWGGVSIIFSPCHLSSLPLVLGVVAKKDISIKKTFSIAVVFSLGVLLILLVIGLISTMLGILLGRIGAWSNLIPMAILLVFGLYFLGVLKLNFLNSLFSAPFFKKVSLWSVLVMGLFFGIGMGACTFAYLSPVMAASLKYAENGFTSSFLFYIAFALGHVTVIVSIAMLGKRLLMTGGQNRNPKVMNIIQKVIGILMLAGAGYFIITFIGDIL